MIRLIRIAALSASSLVTSMVIAIKIAPPAGATTPTRTTYIFDYEGEATCPASHVIKGMTFDA